MAKANKEILVYPGEGIFADKYHVCDHAGSKTPQKVLSVGGKKHPDIVLCDLCEWDLDHGGYIVRQLVKARR